MEATQCDLVNDTIPFKPLTAHFSHLIFVLSAIAPEHFIKVAKKIYDQLAPGAVLYFRDYGKYDLGQIRFAKKANAKLKDNFYVCQDKTRRYYFTLDEVKQIFCGGEDAGAGFECIELKNCYRVVENRKDKKMMHRVWVQAKFRKPLKVLNDSLEKKEESD